jgi:HK97 family phage major capsid protein
MPSNPCITDKLAKLEVFEPSEAKAIALHMCEKAMSPEEEKIWLAAYTKYSPDVQDPVRTALLADGMVARRQQALTVKARDGKIYIEGWAMLFTDDEMLDHQRTYFDDDTTTLLEYYPGAPLFEEHEHGSRPIGKRSAYKAYKPAIWLEHELYQDAPGFAERYAAIQRGEYSYSSDTFKHYAQEGYDPDDGRLGTWILAACSITKTPAEPGLGPVRIKQPGIAAGRSMPPPDNTGDTPIEANLPSVMEDRTEPVEAQKAQDSKDENNLNQKEHNIMNPEQVQALVEALSQALGVEPTLEAVMAALQQFMAAVGGETETEEAAMSYDPAAVRTALGLEADATDDAVKEVMQSFISALEPVPARSVNADALATARGIIGSAAKSAPVIQYAGGHVTGNGKKSFSQVNVNVNAPKPSLGSLVVAIVSGDRKGIANATKSGSTKAAQGATENVLGAYLLSETVSESIIEPLYNEIMLAKLGVDTFTMDSEVMTVRKNLGGSAAYWLGEHENTTESNVTFGVINFTLKEVGAQNRYSRKLFRRAAQIEQIVTNDMRKQIALAIDRSGLRGTGGKPAGTGHTGAEPLGLRNTLPTAQITALATNGAAPAISNINAAISRIKQRNIMDAASWGIAVSTRERQYMTGWTDTTGRPLLRERWDGAAFPQLLGIRVEESNQIPTNLTTGTATDTSEIYVGDWQYAALAMGLDMEVAVSTERYFDSRDIAVQVVAEADFGVYYGEAFEILTGSRGIVT